MERGRFIRAVLVWTALLALQIVGAYLDRHYGLRVWLHVAAAAIAVLAGYSPASLRERFGVQTA